MLDGAAGHVVTAFQAFGCDPAGIRKPRLIAPYRAWRAAS
jgi:hypothetical protein